MTLSAPHLRVLMTADTLGGVWNHSLALSGALARRNVAVCLATIGSLPTREQRAAAEALPNVRLASVEAKLEWMTDPWPDVQRAGRWLRELATDWRPDVIHLNGYAHAALPWPAPVLVAAHSCVLSWWLAVKGGEAPADWHFYRSAVGCGLEAADVIVAPSRTMLNAIACHYGRTREAYVIPNGVSTVCLPRTRKEPIVFSAGRLWDEAKNIATLDRAAARISWPVHVAGESKHPDGGVVRLLHARAIGQLAPADVQDWQARASIFALAARYEPFGLAALEAARAGCALVLGDIPSQREIWNKAALLVPPDDAGALAQAIQMLIDDPHLRTAMADRARRRAGRFTADRMAGRYHVLYARLRTRGPRRSLATAA